MSEVLVVPNASGIHPLKSPWNPTSLAACVSETNTPLIPAFDAKLIPVCWRMVST